jgi:lipoate-protein ligase A
MMRHLPELVADGPTQMAWDEALLVACPDPTPVMRLYQWSVPTISLGCFQDHAAIAPHLPPGLPVVRRITGGGAIWHADEVTWALAGQLGSHGLPDQARDLYPLLHGALRGALNRAGARLVSQPESVGDRRYRNEPRCFASPAADDLLGIAGGKTLGSAARARGGRVLIHGSLKLASNPWDGAVASGCGLSRAAASAAVVKGLQAALGNPVVVTGDPLPAETAAMEDLRRERYGTTDWVVARAGLRP